MKSWVLIGLCGCLAVAVATARPLSDAPEQPQNRSFAMSGDGSHVFYISTSQTPTLWRRGVGADAVPEPVALWAQGAMHFVTSESADTVMVMRMGAGAAGMDMDLYTRTADGTWISNQVLTAARVSGFEGSRDQYFYVITQPGPGVMERLKFTSDGREASKDVFHFDAADIVYGPNLLPRLYLDATEQQAVWRPVSSGTTKASAKLPSDKVIERILFASGRDPAVFALARLPGSDELSAVEVNWETGVIKSYFSQPSLDVDGVIRSADGHRVDAVRFEGDRVQTQNVTDSLGQDMIFLEGDFGMQPDIVSRSLDDKVWLLRVSFKDRPAQHWVHDQVSKKNVRVDPAVGNEAELTVPASAYRVVSTSDGVDIPTYLAPPPVSACDVAKEKCPLVVLIHGGPTRRDRLAYDPDAAWLQRQGFWVLRANYRGSAGYGWKFRRSGDREWGRKMIADINLSVRTALASAPIDPRQVTAMGASYGGFAALAAATQEPSMYRCAISINGGGDLVQFAKAGKLREPALAQGIAMQVGDPDIPADLGSIETQSPMNKVADLRANVLQVVAMKDQITDPLQSLNYARALETAGKENELLRLQNGDHAVTDPADRKLMYRTMHDFLAKCR